MNPETMPSQQWTFIAQRGFFSHDDDPESWDFRATTREGLGILDRAYPTDNETNAKSQWERLIRYIEALDQEDTPNRRYKLFYVIRHGEGIHNVKEREVGREEWDRKWATLPGDGTVTWLDAELTAKGQQQAQDIVSIWTTDMIPPPQSIYSSPLRRCLHTTTLALSPVMTSENRTNPIIKERLRERLGVHTCDQRSSKKWISEHYPEFLLEDGFTEEDELWTPDRRETIDEHAARSKELFEDIFENDDSVVISLTAHSGAIMAIFAATGWNKIPVAAGAVYPLLICGTKRS
ncbi:hypothetical protein NX059_004615 [Plenodomus lindquistii]|nr:hypothetical protein NX059_004615 [Plenodomus lindquistii]